MSIGRNALTNIVGAVSVLLLTLVTLPFYIRMIGEERYGTLALIWMMFGYFGFFDLGLGKATAQRISRLSSEEVQQASDIVWSVMCATLGLGLVGGVLMWLSAESLLVRFAEMSDASRAEGVSAVPWLVLALPLVLVNSVMGGALQARERFVTINAVSIASTATSLAVPLLAAFLGYRRLETLVPAALCGNLLTSLIYFVSCLTAVPLSRNPRVQFGHLRPLLSYGSGVSLISLLAPLLVTIDRVVIAATGGAMAVAYYTVPYSLVTRLGILAGGLSTALFPRLAASGAEESNRLAGSATSTIVALMTPIVVVGAAMTEPFLNIWVGSEFAIETRGVGEILLLGVWLNSLVAPHYARLTAVGRLRPIIIAYIFEIPFYFLLLWAGNTLFGIAGAAAAWSLRVLLDTIILLWVSNVLATTTKMALASFVVAFAAIIVSLFVHTPAKWFAECGLLAVAMYLGRSVILHAANPSNWRTTAAKSS